MLIEAIFEKNISMKVLLLVFAFSIAIVPYSVGAPFKPIPFSELIELLKLKDEFFDAEVKKYGYLPASEGKPYHGNLEVKYLYPRSKSDSQKIASRSFSTGKSVATLMEEGNTFLVRYSEEKKIGHIWLDVILPIEHLSSYLTQFHKAGYKNIKMYFLPSQVYEGKRYEDHVSFNFATDDYSGVIGLSIYEKYFSIDLR